MKTPAFESGVFQDRFFPVKIAKINRTPLVAASILSGDITDTRILKFN